MNKMSREFYEETVFRAGMQVCGGNLSMLQRADPVNDECAGSAAWAGRDMGLFVVNSSSPEIVDLQAIAVRNVIACTVVVDENRAETHFVIGDRGFDSEGSDMTMAFVPRGECFSFATQTKRILRAVTIVFDPISLMKTYSLNAPTLPNSLLNTVYTGKAVMDKLIPGRFGMIATEIIARGGMFASVASLYYEGKTLELISTLLSQLSRREAMRAGDGVIDPRTFERLEEVKKIINQAPQRALDIDALARAAAMNRTKLRSSFKQAYGITLSNYRTSLLLQKGDRALRELGFTVERAAYRAGYTSASSFIVAYKRRYGVSPGDVLRQKLAS